MFIFGYCFEWQEVARISMDMSGSLEDVIARLKAYQAQMQTYKPKMDELEGFHQVRMSTIISMYLKARIALTWENKLWFIKGCNVSVASFKNWNLWVLNVAIYRFVLVWFKTSHLEYY